MTGEAYTLHVFDALTAEQPPAVGPVATTVPFGPTMTGRIPAIVATLATDGWDRTGFNG
jgi:hypothetical protein